MSTDIFKIITNEAKETISPMNVVTPTIYASIFSKYAHEHNQEINDEEKMAIDILKSECSNLTNLQNEVSKNADKLSNSTAKAIDAIKEQDTATLNEVFHETQLLKKEIEKLKDSLYKDELTQVYNRKWLHDKCLQEDSNNFKNDGVLVMLDLNYFKIINDTHGHIIGDKVLIFIANQLKKLKHQHTLRYGGDEFILLSTSATKTQITQEVEQLRESILSKKLKAHNSEFRVSFSFGSAPYKQGDSLSAIIENADKVMYEDKEAIKKRVTGI